MKSLVLLLAILAVTFAVPTTFRGTDPSKLFVSLKHQSTQGTYYNADPNDASVQAAQAFGLQQVLANLKSQKTISSSDIFSVSKLNSAQQKFSTSAITYKFDLELNNNAGTVIKTTFEVVVSPTGNRSLGNVNVNINKTSQYSVPKPVETLYVTFNVLEIQSNVKTQIVFNFGLNYILQYLVQQNQLKTSDWKLLSTTSGAKQAAAGYNFYKFVVVVSNSQGDTATLAFIVSENTQTGDLTILAPSDGLYILSTGSLSPKPVPGTRISLQPSNYPTYILRHRNFEAWIDPVDGVRNGLPADGTFTVRPGNCGGNTVSFESVNYPGRFLRHSLFLLWLQPVGDPLSNNDSCFNVRSPLNSSAGPASYTFESVNYPGYFIRHQNFRVKLNPSDGSDLFRADATWVLTAPLVPA